MAARNKRKRVNRRGVFSLAIAAVVFIVLLQFIEDAGQVSSINKPSESEHTIRGATDRVYKMFIEGPAGKLASSLMLFSHNDRQKSMDMAMQARNISEFVNLVKPSGTDRAIILTYVSFDYRLTLINWLISLAKVGVDSVGIICLDKELQTYLSKRGVPCFLQETENNNNNSGDSGSGNNHNRGNKMKEKVKSIAQLWVMRMLHLLELLNQGHDVIFSDTDAVWVENVIESGMLSKRMGDIVVSRGEFPYDVGKAWGATGCFGLVYFRASGPVIKLIGEAYDIAVKEGDDQVGLNRALFQNYGADPLPIFGRKLDVFESKDAILSATDTLPRVVILAHTTIPRFCNRLTYTNWQHDVKVAHCHSKDGQTTKTYKNWGNSKSRNNIMQKYGLWCDLAADSPKDPEHFALFLKEAAQKCRYLPMRDQ